MDVLNIIKEVEDKGIQLWQESGKLKFRAPEKVMTDAIRNMLKENKPEIIRILSERTCPQHDEEHRYEKFELTDIQSSYLYGSGDAYGLGDTGCQVYAILQAPVLEDERFRDALQKVVERHDMLHTDILSEGKQQVKKEVPRIDLRVIELGNASEDEREKILGDEKERGLSRRYKAGEWPFFEFTLIHLGESDRITISIDMLVADFASLRILVREIEAVYFGEELENLELTFRDFLQWKSKGVSEKKYREAERYWLDRIETLAEAPDLPVNENVNSSGFQQNSWLIPEDVWKRIGAISRESGITPSNLLLTVYAEVIGLWSGKQKFTINLTMADRPDVHCDIQRIIGDFTIVDLLEIDNTGRIPYMEKAGKIQEQLFRDLAHKAFTGVQVMRSINRAKSKVQLFPVVYTSTIGASTVRESDRFRLREKITKTPQVYIDCQVASVGETVLVSWDVREGIFPEGMIEDMFQVFTDRIRKLASGGLAEGYVAPEIPAGSAVVRTAVNGTGRPISGKLMYDGILDSIRNTPEKTAVICDGQKATYGQLGEMAAALEKVLLEKGVRPGQVVAVNIRKSIWQIAAVIGVQWCGAAYLPLGYDQPEERKESILNRAGVHLCVTDTDVFPDDMDKINVEEIEVSEGCAAEPVRVPDTEKAYIIYTSGSTGVPKGVVISHRAAVNTLEDINDRFGITGEDVVFAVANLAFDLSVYDIFGILGVGGCAVIPTEDQIKDAVAWEQLIRENKVTVWNSVPAQMEMLILYIRSLEKKAYDLRLVLMSGDWIPVTLPGEIHRIFEKAEIVSLGGATEAAIWSIYHRIDPEAEYERSIPYGTPLGNQFFRIMNENLDECPDNVTGELMIGGVGLAEEYHNDPEQTAASFIIHPRTSERLYRTGDIGRYGKDGVIEFQGRKDTQVKINGHRVELCEIESVLLKQKDVASAAVIANNNAIVAFVKPVECRETSVTEDAGIREIVRETGEKETGKIDKALFDEWSGYADQTAVYDILNTLRKKGVFDEDRGYSIEEISERVRVHDAFRGLLLRWLGALVEEGIVEKSRNDGTYLLRDRKIAERIAEDYWEKWKSAEEKLGYSRRMMDYFGEMREKLPVIMDGTLDPLDVYFPKGDPSIAIAAYHDNIISSCMNQVMVQVVKELTVRSQEEGKGKIRILEIGAGMGGATREIVPALKNADVEYLFSDISQFYLNEAKQTFAEYPFMKYLLVNMDKPLENQGVEKESVDLVLFSQAIHNADSIPSVLSNIGKALKPAGKIMIAETTREHRSLLTSVSFNAGIGENMLSVEEYAGMFRNEGITLDAVFPEEGSSIDSADQHLFIGTYVKKSALIHEEELIRQISGKLPEYMVPSRVCVIDEIPLSANKKVDRQKLVEMLEENRNPFVSASGELPRGELEEQLEKIWAAALNREYLYRNENFYKAGGDSLLIAQIVAEMKEKIPLAADMEWDELMRTIIEAPTIMEVAERLMESGADPQGNKRDGNIVVFAEGKNRSLLRVLFHDGTGTVYPYQNLVPHLLEYDREHTVIGISNTDPEDYSGRKPENLVMELGEKYGKLLAEKDYEKYELIGFCFGGILAVETAKVLMQEGREVLPVRTIDTPHCDRRIKSDILMERIYAMANGGDPVKLGYPTPGEIEEVLRKMQGEACIADRHLLTEKLSTDPEERLGRIYQCVKDNPGFRMTEEEFRANYKINRICFDSLAEYNEIFIGDVSDLYCTEDRDVFYPMLQGEGGTFWKEKVLGNLEEIRIPGNHNSCMQEPVVVGVAELIAGEPFSGKGDRQ
uniref:Amino acid adenylation enzyme/thioester reductase family protein n=1 Tax=Eubacterium cellulosolvens (strain ATCC 43171 / JCM 9499 / 6) TaxID=633697 RepID=I5AX00_EUBC6